MDIKAELIFINKENFQYFSSEEISYQNLNPYGSLSWLMSKKTKNDKVFTINFINNNNQIKYKINGLIKNAFNIKLIHSQSGILFKDLTPSFDTYNQILKAFKNCFKKQLTGLISIRYEPIYQTSPNEKRALFFNNFCSSSHLQNSGFSRYVIEKEVPKKIKKEIKRFAKSEIKINYTPFKKNHIKEILYLHNKLNKSKGLSYDRRMNSKFLIKMIDFFGEKINLIMAEDKNKKVGFSLWIDTFNNSIYFRGASNREYGALGIGYALVQEKINIFLEDNKIPRKFIDLGGIGIEPSTIGVDKFKERFNSYEVEYLGAFDYYFSFLAKIIFKFIYFLKRFL